MLVAAAVGLLTSALSLSDAAVGCTGLVLANTDALGWCLLSLLSPLCASPEIEAKYSKKMQVLRDELDLRRKTEIHEVEERKNNQISELMKNHEKAFSEIKNYYNDITLKNLALISLLKVLPACSLTPLPQPWLVVSPVHHGAAPVRASPGSGQLPGGGAGAVVLLHTVNTQSPRAQGDVACWASGGRVSRQHEELGRPCCTAPPGASAHLPKNRSRWRR